MQNIIQISIDQFNQRLRRLHNQAFTCVLNKSTTFRVQNFHCSPLRFYFGEWVVTGDGRATAPWGTPQPSQCIKGLAPRALKGGSSIPVRGTLGTGGGDVDQGGGEYLLAYLTILLQKPGRRIGIIGRGVVFKKKVGTQSKTKLFYIPEAKHRGLQEKTKRHLRNNC